MRSPICHVGDISETRRKSIPAGRATNDGMRGYETNDNNVVEGSHVADLPDSDATDSARDRLRYSKVTEGNSATELINMM
jgi:hypothetical protein